MSTDEERLPPAGLDPEEIQSWLATADFSQPVGIAPEDVPPADLPVSVLRAVRIPHELDQSARAIAEARGVTVSTLLREWIVAGVAGATEARPDPVVDLRVVLGAAQRALDTLTRPDAA